MSQQVCAIPGVGPGLGAALTRRFAASGYAVAALARDVDRLEELTAGIDGARAFACDVADAADVTRAFDTVAAELGPVTTLLYNAGNAVFGAVDQVSPADFEAEPPSSWIRWAIRPFAWAQSEAIREVLTDGTDRRDDQLAELREIEDSSAVEVAVIAPSRPEEMAGRLTTHVPRLRRTAEIARADVAAMRDRIRELVRVS
jgi:hypothetical protein